MNRSISRLLALGVLFALCAGTLAIRRALLDGSGLNATFTAERQWGTDARARKGVGATTEEIEQAWTYAPPAAFRAQWRGFVVAPRLAWYVFAASADDAVTVTIDGFKVATTRHDRGTGEGRILLSRGAHPIVIDYEQIGGVYRLNLSWAREGQSPSALPRWALWTSAESVTRAVATRVAGQVLTLLLIAFALGVIWNVRHQLRSLVLQIPRLDWGLLLVLLFGAYFRLQYVDLPMADAHGWRQLFNADVARNFAEQSMNIWDPRVSWGGGGDNRVSMEFPLLSWLAAAGLYVFGEADVDFVCRVVAIAFSLATIVGVYGLATSLWGRAAGRGAAFLIAVSPSAIFFGRAFISDTPSLCFSVFGVWGYLLYLETGRRSPLIWGTISASLACMVKLPAVVIFAPLVWLAWQSRRWSVLSDRPLVAGLAAVLLLTVVWYAHAELIFRQTYLGVAIFHPVGGYSPEVMEGAGTLTLVTSWNTVAQLRDPGYYHALADRFWRLHFTPVGTVLVLVGALVCFRARRRRFVDMWFAGVASFIVLAAEGNRWHEFYQLPILLPSALYFGLAARPAFDFEKLGRKTPLRLGVAVSILALGIVGLTGFRRSGAIQEWFRPDALRLAPIRIGEQLQELTPPDALLVTVEYDRFGGNSPVLFYYARRRGWSFDATALTPAVLERLHEKFGARYFVSSNWSQLVERQPGVVEYLKAQREIPVKAGNTALFALQ